MSEKQSIFIDHCTHLRVTSIPLADANGNCVTYVDNSGNVQAHYTYDAFGNTVSSSGDMDDDFRFRFSSKYLDDETGLYFYGYRYYTPALGRWVSRDPIEEWGGLLLYGFVRNDGVDNIDVSGFMPFDWGRSTGAIQPNQMGLLTMCGSGAPKSTGIPFKDHN